MGGDGAVGIGAGDGTPRGKLLGERGRGADERHAEHASGKPSRDELSHGCVLMRSCAAVAAPRTRLYVACRRLMQRRPDGRVSQWHEFVAALQKEPLPPDVFA